jgi:putative transposase
VLTGVKMAATLSAVLRHRQEPHAITADNGGEFVSRAMDAWAYAHDVRLDFIRPGKPVENAFIEGFNASSATSASIATSLRPSRKRRCF